MKRTCYFFHSCPSWSLLTAFLVWLLLLSSPHARAATYTYNTGVSQRTVNAGILLIDSTMSATTPAKANPDPYVFYVLSQRPDVTPYGWNILNPLAPKTVTADIQQRYANATPPYTIAQSLTPNMAAYWEVRLSQTSAADLQQFNVLLIDLKGAQTVAQFSASDVEKLRQFVDGGGTLWIEGGQGATIGVPNAANNANGLFFDLQFATGNTIPTSSPRVAAYNTASGAPAVPSIHALVSAPYFLQHPELDTLPYTNNGTGDSLSSLGSSSSFLTPVLNYYGGATIAIAGSYGAGAIVATSTGTATIINNGVNALTMPTYPSAAAAQANGIYPNLTAPNLKFLVNIIAWGGGHPGEGQGSHHNGAAFNSFPSPVHVWNALVQGATSVPPTPAIYGSLAFVTDAAGTLHAYTITPGTKLADPYTQVAGGFDNGNTDYSTGTSFDEVWHTTTAANPNGSAPVVATDANGNVLVLVETDSGAVKVYNSSTGAAATGTGIANGILLNSGAAGASFNALPVRPAPAPTVYNGSVYASQPDGTLYVANLATGTTSAYKPVVGTLPTPTGSPAVGIVPVDTSATGIAPTANDILAMMPTSQSLYSILLGSRGEQLRPTGTQTEYLTKLQGAATIANTSALRVYTPDATTGYAITPTTTTLNGTSNGFTGLMSGFNYFGDYDTTLDPAISDLTRTIVNIANSSFAANTPLTGTMSAPAIDRFGNAVYTTNANSASSLVSFHDSPTNSNVHLNWRFRLPTTSDLTLTLPSGAKAMPPDADGADYTSLVGFTFQGAPVVDETGNVYALATNGNQAAIICINGLLPVTTAPIPASGSFLNIMQTDESGNASNQIRPSQYTQTGNTNPGAPTSGGPLTLVNFGTLSGALVQRTLNPNLSEPQALSASFDATGGNPSPVPLHTNVAWFTVLASPTVTVSATQPPSGLTKAGNALFFVDGAGHLISVIANPGDAGIPIVNKYVGLPVVNNQQVQAASAAALPPLVVDYGDTGVGIPGYGGVSGGAPAIADGALIVNGASGSAGFANRVTLVADSSRLIEFDSGGEATWVADATTGVPPGTPAANAAALLAPSLELNHPSSVMELTANDYLIADTGNNRCVRFDRSGKVKWELSRINDAYNVSDSTNVTSGDDVTQVLFHKISPVPGTPGTRLLAPSEPDTLNQPTSVQIYSEPVEVNGIYRILPTDPNFRPNYTVVHYLISDSGNYRILDVVDVFDTNNNIVGAPHNLVWVSHTHDKQQREYRYQSAAYFTSPTGSNYVVALVTNKRIPGNTRVQTQPTAANQDASGASIVLLNQLYDPTKPSDGLIDQVQSQFQANITTTGAFDLSAAAAGTAGTPLYIRNPRYLKAYVPQNNPTGFAFLLADDNGVFDLAPQAAGALVATWGFTQADYQAVTVPIDSSGAFSRGKITGPPTRPAIPFVPGSIQRLGSDKTTGTSYGRYLITNGYSQGEASVAQTPPNGALPGVPGFGGEALELSVVAVANRPITTASGAHALSRPTNTGPLVQPTFAYRVP